MHASACLSSLLILAASLTPTVRAQATLSAQNSPAIYSMDKDRVHLVYLDGLWRFHPGDDPHWADPSFDDSQWALIDSTRGWSEQGYKNMSGLAWYRVKVEIPEGSQSLALYVVGIITSYQVFADGQMIGQSGGMPPHARAYSAPRRTFQLPKQVFGHAHTAILAIRVWHWPLWAMYVSGGLQTRILIGQSDLVDAYAAVRINVTKEFLTSSIIFVVLYSLAALASVVLFALRPREKEYLWFGAAQMALVGSLCLDIANYFHPISIVLRDDVQTFLGVAHQLLLVGFYFNLLRARRDWSLWLAIGSMLLETWSILMFYPLQTWLNEIWPISIATINMLTQFMSLPATLWIDVLIIRRVIQGYPDARLVIVPQLISDLWALALANALIANQLGASKLDYWNLDHIWQNPFPISISDVISLLFLLAMLAILIHRFAHASLHEERMAGELEAARTVQHVLIPDETPSIPGFVIEAVYKPASEVGGDFFQIIPVSNGGLLAIIGDVSGKGMPAAMTVSLLVGTVRTLAHYTQSPSEILSAMNQRMLARSQGGFTTCLVLHVDASGTLTVANAGHLAPYLNGAELEIENGLPLGLTEHATYPSSTFQLTPDARLTLMTDGVVEARNRAGELFGFDRTRTIAAQSPESIAKEAQAFGQQDDITVLTLSLQSAG